jgi:hemolysin D
MAGLVYEARLRLAAQAVSVNGRAVPLAPGMTVAVEIKTGQRRVIEYLFSPLVEAVGNAGSER